MGSKALLVRKNTFVRRQGEESQAIFIVKKGKASCVTVDEGNGILAR